MENESNFDNLISFALLPRTYMDPYKYVELNSRDPSKTSIPSH